MTETSSTDKTALTIPADVERALAADRHIRALDRAISLLVATAPTDGSPYCSGCLWEVVVRPLATPLVGWGRGRPQEQAPDSDEPVIVLLSDVDPDDFRPTPAETVTEEWLRTSETWNAVTGWWMGQLDEADPGKGHGFPGFAR